MPRYFVVWKFDRNHRITREVSSEFELVLLNGDKIPLVSTHIVPAYGIVTDRLHVNGQLHIHITVMKDFPKYVQDKEMAAVKILEESGFKIID